MNLEEWNIFLCEFCDVIFGHLLVFLFGASKCEQAKEKVTYFTGWNITYMKYTCEVEILMGLSFIYHFFEMHLFHRLLSVHMHSIFYFSPQIFVQTCFSRHLNTNVETLISILVVYCFCPQKSSIQLCLSGILRFPKSPFAALIHRWSFFSPFRTGPAVIFFPPRFNLDHQPEHNLWALCGLEGRP